MYWWQREQHYKCGKILADSPCDCLHMCMLGYREWLSTCIDGKDSNTTSRVYFCSCQVVSLRICILAPSTTSAHALFSLHPESKDQQVSVLNVWVNFFLICRRLWVNIQQICIYTISDMFKMSNLIIIIFAFIGFWKCSRCKNLMVKISHFYRTE